jgi:predicted phage tail protein
LLRKVYLHGQLAQKYGHEFQLDVRNPAEAVRALASQFKGFQNDLVADAWHVIRGPVESGRAIDEHELKFGLGRSEIHFVPAAEGAGPTFKVILGVTIMAAAFVFAGPAGGLGASTLFGLTTYGNIALMGAGLVLSGVAQMLAPNPSLKGGKAGDQRESFLFGSTANVDAEGGPVPRLYGRAWTGSVVISGGISSDRIADPSSDPAKLASTWTGPGTGGGGGKSSGGSQASPFDTPNSLRTVSRVNIIDLITRGPSGGLADGLKSVKLDGTPVQNDDGSFNYYNIVVETRNGLPDQGPLDGFPGVEAETSVNAEVKKNTPVTRVISDENVDAVSVKIRIPSLIDSNNADHPKTSVQFAIDVQPNGGTFGTKILETIGPDKTSSPVELGYRVPLQGSAPWTVRVRRITDDSTRDTLQNATYWASYTTIIDERFSYPHCALVGISGNANDFGNNIPQRNYDWRGIEIKIPTNLDPETREYSGVWDGTFKLAAYDGIAWVLYDLLTNKIGGLGQFIDESIVDKWALYSIGQYFDETVPDGFGGYEPRATFNGAITAAEDAWKVLQTVASGIRAQPYWGGGTITFAADMPTEPVAPISQANTLVEGFTYAGVSQKTRHSVVHVTWFDQEDTGNQKIEVVEDRALIQKIGRKVQEIVAVGCTSRGQAHRVGLWFLNTEAQAETVAWSASFDQAKFRPGNIIPINDPAYAGIRRSGRIKSFIYSSSPDAIVGITLDAPVTLTSSDDFLVSITMPDGTAVTRDVTDGEGATDELHFDTPLPDTPVPGAIWSLSGGGVKPRPFFLVGLKESAPHQFDFSAIIHDPNKYDRIDLGVTLDTDSYSAIPTGPIKAPSLITVSDKLVLVGGSTAAQRVTVSWTPPQDARVALFEVQYAGEGELFQDGGRSNTPSIDIDNVGSGNFVFRVRALDSLGRASPWAQTTTLSLDGLLAPPDDVQNFKLSVLGETATASWDAVEALNLDHYEIRFSPDVFSAQYGTSSILLPRIAGTSAQVPAMSGTYFVKGVTRQGIASVNAASVISTISGALNFNAVFNEEEEPGWTGSRTDTVVDFTNALRLDFEDDIGDWPHIEDVPELAFGVGGGTTVGSYQIDQPIDLSEVYTSRVSVLLRVDATNDLEAISSWVRLSDVASLSNIDPSEWSVLLEVRTTNDDPLSVSPAPSWSDWEEFRVGDYSARGFDFRVTLRTNRIGISPRVLNMDISIDMPDRVVAEDALTCPDGGLRVTYVPRFKAVPGVGINARDMATGDYYTKSNEAEDGFDIEFFNAAGVSQERTFGYVAKGYGKVTA